MTEVFILFWEPAQLFDHWSWLENLQFIHQSWRYCHYFLTQRITNNFLTFNPKLFIFSKVLWLYLFALSIDCYCFIIYRILLKSNFKVVTRSEEALEFCLWWFQHHPSNQKWQSIFYWNFSTIFWLFSFWK